MQPIRDLAVRILNLDPAQLCRCGGAHEICLQCRVCHADRPAVTVDPEHPAPYIDHTLLKPEARAKDIEKLCLEADRYGFVSVCVNPLWVQYAAGLVRLAKVCSVIGFPLGTHKTATKIAETEAAIADGATEIDMVINQGWLRDGLYEEVLNDIAAVAEVCRHHHVLLKVIHENCNLSDEQKVIACLLSKKAGADYVKTSTGFATSGATEEDVRVMRAVVGPHLGVKAAGGIRDRATTQAMLRAGADRIGASRSLSIIGVSE